MPGSSVDSELLQLLTAAAPASIPEVIAVMQSIDALLPSGDGLKWFNKLYMLVTQRVDTDVPPGGWKNAAWLRRLDVVFAGFYFRAAAEALQQDAATPSSWQALFEARTRADVHRIQFALAGMNAHINHDLALALIQTDEEFGLEPGAGSDEYADYENVNRLLEEVIPSALEFLASGIVGEIAQDAGEVGRLLAMWNIAAARDLAWEFAGHLRRLQGAAREFALATQDQMTGVIGRGLMLPSGIPVTPQNS